MFFYNVKISIEYLNNEFSTKLFIRRESATLINDYNIHIVNIFEFII